MPNDDTLLRTQLITEYDQIAFSDTQKQRLIAKLAPRGRSQAFAWRRGASRTLIAAAATVALAGTAVAVTASQGLTPADVVSEVFGSETAHTDIVDKIGHPIGATDSSNGVRITADSIIGDSRNYAIVYTIEKEDGSAFSNLPEAGAHGLLPLGFKRSDTRVPGESGSAGSAYFVDRDPSDNALQYVEEMTVFGDRPLSGSTAKVALQDLFIADQGLETITKGKWNLKFRIEYEDASIPGPAGQTFQLPSGPARITRESISPLAISIDYEVEAPSIDGDSRELSRVTELPPSRALLTDGTTVELTQGGTQCDLNESTKRCSTSLKFPQLTDPKMVQELKLL